MKKISLTKQRSMYRSYKEARLGEEDNSIRLLRSGTYAVGDVREYYEKAWEDILTFVSGLEDVIVEEAEREREEYMIGF